jgi:transposase-like protein
MRKNNNYKPEFKIQIVKEYLKGGISYNSLKNKYNLLSSTQLKNWVKQYQEFGESSFYEEKRGRKSTGRPKDYDKMTDAEKVRFLEMENAILKKVAALTQKN